MLLAANKQTSGSVLDPQPGGEPHAPQAVSEGLLWAMDRMTFRALIVHSMAEKRDRYEGVLERMGVFKNLTAGVSASWAHLVLHHFSSSPYHSPVYPGTRFSLDCSWPI
jgi:hypothetical protein